MRNFRTKMLLAQLFLTNCPHLSRAQLHCTERSPHTRLRQRMACTHAIQGGNEDAIVCDDMWTCPKLPHPKSRRVGWRGGDAVRVLTLPFAPRVSVSNHAPESFLVDSPAPRRETVEPEQLSHRHDSVARRRGRHPGTHAVQGEHLYFSFGQTCHPSERPFCC